MTDEEKTEEYKEYCNVVITLKDNQIFRGKYNPAIYN